MWAPWVAHHYPGITPRMMQDIRWTTYVALWDSTKTG